MNKKKTWTQGFNERDILREAREKKNARVYSAIDFDHRCG